MAGEKIIVTITPAGSTKIDAQGFKGGACEKATEQLHVVLGGAANAGTKKRKPDFFAKTGASTNQRMGG